MIIGDDAADRPTNRRALVLERKKSDDLAVRFQDGHPQAPKYSPGLILLLKMADPAPVRSKFACCRLIQTRTRSSLSFWPGIRLIFIRSEVSRHTNDYAAARLEAFFSSARRAITTPSSSDVTKNN